MTTEKYYDLKVYIKTIILPGTLPFESGRSTNPASKGGYQKWIKSELRLIGPRFFPRGAERLVWPKDYDEIYDAVNHVVRALSFGVRRYHKKMKMAQNRGHSGGTAAGRV